MTTGNEPGDSTRLSRRRLLAGLTGLGAVGMAGGAGTFAYLADGKSIVDNTLGAGEVAFDISCGSNNTANCTVSDGVVSFAIDGIDRGSHGTETFEVAVQTNPARLWLATTCPPISDPFGEALEASLTIADTVVYAGSIAGLRRELVNGVRTDDLDDGPCLAPEESIEITLAWSLPETASGSLQGKSSSLEFRLYTEQCRHVSEADAAGSNPFADSPPCEERTCVICESGDIIERLTLEYLGDESAHVVARTRGRGPSGDVVFSGSVAPGGTFVADGSGLQTTPSKPNGLGTNLYIDDTGDGTTGDTGPDSDVGPGNGRAPGQGGNPGGGSGGIPGERIHTSCSEDIRIGDTFGRYRIVGGRIAGRGDLCEGDGGTSHDAGETDSGDDESDTDADCIVCAGENRFNDLTFRYLGVADATIHATTTRTGSGGDAVVFEADTVASGETFTVNGSDVSQTWTAEVGLGPETTLSILDGGDEDASPAVRIHTSCSEPLLVGDGFGSGGSGGPLYELVAGTVTDGSPLCGPEALS